MRSELKIDLKKLSNQGLDFSYNQESEELSQKLKPLIGTNNYNIQFHIRSEGSSSYSISGTIQTGFQLSCSRCAFEFIQPINKKFKEKILLQKKLTRIDKQVKNNHFSELMNAESWTVIDKTLFDAGDFLHELIAIEEPLRPLGGETCDNDRSPCKHLEKMKQKIRQSERAQIHFAQNG